MPETLLKDISLKSFNTFGIDVKASQFAEVDSVGSLIAILKEFPENNTLILGGGSNMLLTGDVEGLVLHINLHGISEISRTEEHVNINVAAGENWHELVRWCIDHDFGGIENLSLIPGNAGTAPIQNIGAYGTELKDVFVSCSAIERSTGKEYTFSHEDCKFGYRDSIFKGSAKDRFIITSIELRLTHKNHRLNTGYGAIEAELANRGITNPGIRDISDAVIAIRQSKLPDPAKLGNSGSFFKNPVIPVKDFKKIQEQYTEIPSYPVTKDEVKVPAGWLIEQCGFKGKRFGDAGVHEKQALVLVNHGNATGKEILQLAEKIRTTVLEKFNISIQPEVNII
ncbi:UDP-N-acetylmuramate dehydrogenase [Robertkochia solimangrovi]|uniref:UDP-N-acetylmuramate dehydrogenase n=1 Tax=Robertkochia solimangrovi TaxID=2213046 RepID=UPI00117E7EEE|nr:UDP-N-acetylmuramate dehydrogenase [Robertkochia solimangrovi]TRZ41443.1 UDP-N-acetylenolpyruvoylglucosamine reductase [Robertkochia solimangrovi]